MLELRQDLPLAAKAALHAAIVPAGGDQFDGHLLPVLSVGPLAQVDHAHPAPAEFA